VVSSASLRAWHSTWDSSSSQRKSPDCSTFPNPSAGSSAPSEATGTLWSSSTSKDAALGSLRSSITPSTGPSHVFLGALVTRWPCVMRGRHSPSHLLDPAPGDTGSSGANPTERKTRAAGLHDSSRISCHRIPLDCTGSGRYEARIIRAHGTTGQGGSWSACPAVRDNRI
jgi:hypothetical protein